MTKKDAEKIAEIVMQKLAALMNTDVGNLNGVLEDVITNGDFHITDEEMYLGELARLETLRMLYQEKEEFEKCNILKNKIDIIKDRLKRAKVELKLKTNKQLLNYYNANKKIVIGDEFFIKRITETKELIKKVDKFGFEMLVKQNELFNHFNDNKIFDRGL